MFSTEYLLKGVAAPAVTAFAATLLFSWLFSGRRAVAAAAFALGQAVGLGLAVWGSANWFPSRNLHWPPWLAVVSAVVGPIIVAGGLAFLERWLLALLAALATAALIVPDWPELWPARPISMAAVTAALACIARGAESVARRQPARLMGLTVCITAVAASALIAASLSFRLGESALTTASALTGVALALLIRPDESAIRGLALPYAIGVGAWCYVAAIELPPPEPPIWGLMLIPAVPLTLWLTACGPPARMTAGRRSLASVVVVLASLAAIGTWVWFSTEQEADEYSQALHGPASTTTPG